MSRSAPQPNRLPNAVLIAALLLPIIVCYTILARYAIAIPLLDDYDATLGFLLRQQQLHGFTPRLLAALSDQQAEYKFLFEHVLLATQFGITGHLSLRFFILLGNLLLLPVLFVFAEDLFSDATGRQRLLLLLPVPYIVCQLTYAEVLNWTVASLNALAVVAFVLLALHFLNRRSNLSLALACASIAIACSASTNAFLLAPIGFAMLCFQRRWPALVAWSASILATLLLYLFRYQRVPHPPGPALATRALFFLSFLGGAIENMHHKPVPGAAILLGALLLLAVAHAALSGYARTNPVMMALAAWVLLTAVTVAWFRSSFGVSQSLSGRYKLYCMLLLVFGYGYTVDRIRHTPALSQARKQLLWRAAFAVTLVFYVSGTVAGADFLKRRHQNLIRGMRHYLIDPDHNTPLDNPTSSAADDPVLQEHLRQVLQQAIAQGIYAVPALP